MKEILTVELTASEVQEAVGKYLKEFGYKTNKIFMDTGFVKFNGTPIRAIVSKVEAPNKPVESIAVVRDEVWEFARAMEFQLRANNHKGGWNDAHHERLVEQLLKNVKCLENELKNTDRDKYEITVRSANIANYAMMIADNYGEGI